MPSNSGSGSQIVRMAATLVFLSVPASGVLARVAPAADDGKCPAFVITPEQAETLKKMAVPEKGAFPGGCKAEEIRIEKSVVRAVYSCADGTMPVVELRHPDTKGVDGIRTEHFIVSKGKPEPKAGLSKAVAARVRRFEGGWTWKAPKCLSASATDSRKGARVPGPDEYPPEIQKINDRATEMIKSGRYSEAFDVLHAAISSSRKPHRGLLGLMVSAVAGSKSRKENVKVLAADADEHPNDHLRQFIAGVASHYCAHQYLKKSEKPKYYNDAIRFLNRTLPLYSDEPRVWIYLAVSYFRTGRQEEAEKAIDRAVEVGGEHDADAYYCRAEVYHIKDVKSAIRDIEKYIEIMEKNIPEGAIHSEKKEHKVRSLLKILQKAARGEAPKDQRALFDADNSAGRP